MYSIGNGSDETEHTGSNSSRIASSWPCHLLSMLAALAVLIQVYARTSGLVVITFDGWVYWEGALSLLAGNGYQTLNGQAITAWPPLFSMYLATWGKLFGLELESIRFALIFLSGIAAYIWSLAWQLHARNCRRMVVAVGFVVLVAYLPQWYNAMLSEALWVPLVGVLYLILSRRQLDVRAASMLTIILVLCLFVRNQSIALLPGVVAFGIMRWGRKQWLMTLIPGILSAGLWMLGRHILRQTGSHDVVASMSFNSLLNGFKGAFLVTEPIMGVSLFNVSVIVIFGVTIISGWVVTKLWNRVTYQGENSGLSRGEALLVFGIVFWLTTVSITVLVGMPSDQARFYLMPVLIVVLSCVLLMEHANVTAIMIMAGAVSLLAASSFVYRAGYFAFSYWNAEDSRSGEFQPSREWIEEVVDSVKEDVNEGADIEQAAARFGISSNTYRRWSDVPLQ